jgi:transposase-like protein
MTRRDWEAVLTREYLEAEMLAGRAPAEIATRAGCALNTVRSYMVRHQLDLPATARPTDAELAELYERFANIRSVAGELDVSYSTARDWLVAAGVPLAPAARPRANFDIDEAARRYQEGEGFAAIARALGVPTMTLRDRLVSEGRVVPRPRGRPKSAGPD